MKVQILVREYADKYGLHSYSQALVRALAEEGARFELIRPVVPVGVRNAQRMLARLGFDAGRFFTTYPLTAAFDRDSVKHLTTQQMGSLLALHPGLEQTVVSVHDIVPHLVRGDKGQDTFRHGVERAFDRLAMAGLRRARLIIASSDYTKSTLVDRLKISADRIRVVPLGVDHQAFKPGPIPASFREKYGLEEDRRHVLYVGATSPRKNLPRLLQAVARVKRRVAKMSLLMVGGSEYRQQHEQLLGMVKDLNLERVVRFVGYVAEEELAHFYNLAEALVFPSLYEGFGLPPLEAMACGTAVIASQAAALPEVVGEAGVLVDPYDVEALAETIERVLVDREWREELAVRGLEQAGRFSWERTAKKTLEVYGEVGGL